MANKRPFNQSNPLTRREFMAKSAAVTTSFTIVNPCVVRGTEANSRVEVGCIGLGGRGSLIGRMLAEHKGFQVTSVAGYFPGIAQTVGEKLGVAKEHRFWGLSGYKKLIADKIDAVFCETPPYCFPEHVTAAVNAGCHVYLAKPVACDVPGCLTVSRMGKKATSNKLVFLVDFQTRTDPFFIEAIRRTHEGLIGGLAMLSSFYTDEAFPDPPKTKTIESRLRKLIWVNDVNLGGGQLVSSGIHALDVALWIAAAHPVSAAGCSRTARRNPHGDSADVYSVTYQFEKVFILNHRGEHLRNTHGFKCGCFAFGQDGYMETDYDGKVWIRGNKGGYRGGVVKNLYREGIRRNLDNFHHSVVNGLYDNPTVEPSVNSTLAAILGREAARKNTMMTWKEMMRENKKLEVHINGLKQ